MPVTRLQQLARMPQQGEGVAALLDTWVGGLSKALTPTTAKRAGELSLKAGRRAEARSHQQGDQRRRRGVGRPVERQRPLRRRQHAGLPAQARLLPDHARTRWIRPLGDEFGELVLNPKKTNEVVADANFWLSLQVFHRALCECEFVNKKLANVDEYVRLQAKAHHKEAAEEAAYDAIGAVMRTESDTPRELLDAVGSEPVLKACALVGHAFGIEVRGNPGRDRGPRLRGAGRGDRRVVGVPHPRWSCCATTGGTTTTVRCSASTPRRGCRWRCCQTGTRRYQYINPKTGERGKVNAKVGETLTPFGFTFYRPFQDGSLTSGR